MPWWNLSGHIWNQWKACFSRARLLCFRNSCLLQYSHKLINTCLKIGEEGWLKRGKDFACFCFYYYLKKKGLHILKGRSALHTAEVFILIITTGINHSVQYLCEHLFICWEISYVGEDLALRFLTQDWISAWMFVGLRPKTSHFSFY